MTHPAPRWFQPRPCPSLPCAVHSPEQVHWVTWPVGGECGARGHGALRPIPHCGPWCLGAPQQSEGFEGRAKGSEWAQPTLSPASAPPQRLAPAPWPAIFSYLPLISSRERSSVVSVTHQRLGSHSPGQHWPHPQPEAAGQSPAVRATRPVLLSVGCGQPPHLCKSRDRPRRRRGLWGAWLGPWVTTSRCDRGRVRGSPGAEQGQGQMGEPKLLLALASGHRGLLHPLSSHKSLGREDRGRAGCHGARRAGSPAPGGPRAPRALRGGPPRPSSRPQSRQQSWAGGKFPLAFCPGTLGAAVPTWEGGSRGQGPGSHRELAGACQALPIHAQNLFCSGGPTEGRRSGGKRSSSAGSGVARRLRLGVRPMVPAPPVQSPWPLGC